VQRRDHGGVDQVGLGLGQAQPQQRAVCSSQAFSGSVVLRPQPGLRFGWISSCSAADPALAGGQLLAQQHEVDFAVVLRALVEGVKPERASVIMFSASQSRESPCCGSRRRAWACAVPRSS
jgi:hypothetical protein